MGTDNLEIEEKLDKFGGYIKQLYNEPEVCRLFLSEFLQSCASSMPLNEPVPGGVIAVKNHLHQLDLMNESRLFHVASDYYEWSLEKRAYDYLS